VLAEVRARDPSIPVVIITAFGTIESAVDSMRAGAYHYVAKPFRIEQLLATVENALTEHRIWRELTGPGETRQPGTVQIVAESFAMRKAVELTRRAALADCSVLLLGESGTGKELFAQAIHRLSPRASKPFVAINCAAIPETLLESELFGHEKGAFTGAVKQTIGKFESANHGTLFLDEIGDLPLATQVKLLRFLQNQVIERIGGRQEIRVDARIICATNQDLDQLMKEARFREDLYYRLNEVSIRVPALREREGDAVVLANFFLRKFNAQFRRHLKGLTSDAVVAIKENPWRGNVRELENRMKRAVVMAEGAVVTASDLELGSPLEAQTPLNLRDARRRAEREAVQVALAQAGGNMSQAARLLGISRPTLYDLVEELGIALGSE
jgi:two-component system NtrC family response regulator